MEAVGRLAGGVAHDFNNLLLAIRGYAELALLKVEARDDSSAEIDEIVDGGRAGCGPHRAAARLQPPPGDEPGDPRPPRCRRRDGQHAAADDRRERRARHRPAGRAGAHPRRPGADRAGDRQPRSQRLRDAMPDGGHARDRGRPGSRCAAGAAASSGTTGRNGRGHRGPDLRAVLHDQGRGRDRPRPLDGARDRQPERRRRSWSTASPGGERPSRSASRSPRARHCRTRLPLQRPRAASRRSSWSRTRPSSGRSWPHAGAARLSRCSRREAAKRRWRWRTRPPTRSTCSSPISSCPA